MAKGFKVGDKVIFTSPAGWISKGEKATVIVKQSVLSDSVRVRTESGREAFVSDGILQRIG